MIVTDIAMPGVDGIEAVTRIRRNNPNARIVFVTVHSESMLVEAGLAAGALGYVLKVPLATSSCRRFRPHSAVGSTSVVSSVGSTENKDA